MSEYKDDFQGDSKANYVHSIFESISEDYDFMNLIISLGMHKLWRKNTMKQMKVKSGEIALDVCCGTCDWTISLAQAVGSQGRVMGVDFSQKMLDIGRDKLVSKGLDKWVDLICADAMNLPFVDNRFDYVTIGFALRNIADIPSILSELKRVVKPNGLVISLDISKPYLSFYRKLFFFYFNKIVPLLAKLFVNKHDQYTWLPKSLINFPDSRELENIFCEVGFSQVRIETFAGGAVALHIGVK